MLVLIISIAVYDSEKINSLPGTLNDKLRLKKLFQDVYDYKIIATQNERVTEYDMKKILLETEQEFSNKSENYQGIMIFYSGHGDEQNLLLSDYDKADNGEVNGIYPTSKFISYFNGNNIRNKARSLIIEVMND